MPTALDPKIKDRALRLLGKGKTPAEVAAELGIPRTTVASWKSRPAPADRHQSERPPSQEVPAPAVAPTEPAAIYIRNTHDVQALRLVPRIRALAEGAGFPEAQVARSLLMLGLVRAEQDPGLLAKAAGLCRGEG